MSITAAEIAKQLRGEVIGDGSVQLTGFAPADCARAGDLTFAEKEIHFAAAEQSHAAAILVSETFAPSQKILIRVKNARVAMAKMLPVFFPPDKRLAAFIPARSLTLRRRLIPPRTSGRIASLARACGSARVPC